ncbi:PAS domain S-box protein [Methanosarcina sp.]|uniref:PAS domain S-box protein n=1 Tax=Methanosarcina sp. TaxID=2213 RepID=UPI002AB90EAE|nr:PAS domain S-box protein [Methanosarcina sp.]MDY9925731.1 PAS domain S-box protein [Methanosarcina sp.]
MTEEYHNHTTEPSDLSAKHYECFENLIDELPLGILSCDREGNITALNDFLLNLLEFPSPDFTKQFNVLTFLPLVESGISAAIEETFTTGRNSSIETLYRSVRNKELFISFKVFPRKDEKGFVYGCHAIIEDLTTKKREKAELEQSTRKDKLISQISDRFINSNFKNIDRDINKTLKDLADFIGADRAFLFSVAENTDYIIKTHEWCADGAISKIQLNEKSDTKKLVFERLSNFQIVNIPNIDKIPKEKEYLQKILQDLNIKSVAMIPLSRYGTFKGFIGIDSKSKRCNWDNKELNVMKIAGGMIANILERKNTESMLLKREKEYEEIVNSLDAAIWKATFDKEGNVLNTYISKPVNKVLRLPDGIIEDDWDKLFAHIDPEDLAKVMEALEQSFKQPDTPLSIDYRLTSSDVRPIWINTIGSSHRLDDGTFITYGTSVNITDKKVAEEEVIRSEKRYRFLIEQLSDAVFINTLEGQILEVNDSASKMLGYSKEELQKMNVYDLLIPESLKKGQEVMKRLEIEKDVRGDTKCLTAKGDILDVEISARLLEGYHGIAQAVVRDITHRKQTENKLRESEALLSEVGRIAKIGGWEFDVLSGVIIWTPEIARIHGRDESANPEDRLYSFPSGSREIFGKAINDAVKKGKSFDQELEFISAKGKHKWVRTIVSPVIKDDNVIKLVGTLQDVTERREAQEELKRNEERYRALFEQSNDAIFLNRLDGQIVEVSKKTCEMFGYTGEELQAMNVVDLLPPDRRDAGTLAMERLRKKRFIHINTVYEKADGETFDAEGSSKVLEGHPNLALAVVRNVSEQKKAEEKITRSEIKYRSVFEKSNDAIIIHNFTGQILEANRMTCEILGYSEEELKQKSMKELISPEEREEARSEMMKVRTTGSTRKEFRMIRSDGSLIFTDISASLLQTQNNTIQAVIRDITDRIQGEAAMLNARIEAETASRTKSEFLANMSHELRTPLNSIIGFSDILIERIFGELNEKQLKYINNISVSGRHLLGLINDILDLSKVEAGKMELHYSEFSVGSVFEEVNSTLFPLAQAKALEIDFKVGPGSGDIQADRNHLIQILYNLVSNAIKFTPEGGRVSIHCEKSGNRSLFSVKDTGIGISSEDQKKLFQSFTQIDSSSARQYCGTGLGLVLVKKLVELHGGKIWIESEVGQGSSFTFELPVGNEDDIKLEFDFKNLTSAQK